MENQEMNNKPCATKIFSIIAIVLSIISITMSAFTLGSTFNSANRHRNRFSISTNQEKSQQDRNNKCPNYKQGQENNCPANMNNRNKQNDFYNFFRNMPNFNNNDSNRPNMQRFNRPSDSGMTDKIGNEPPKVENEIKAPQ